VQGLAACDALFMLLVSCNRQKVVPGQVQDEALRAGRSAASMPAADDPYFHDMDGGIPLTVDEVKGRNTWIVWTGGNDRFWDRISNTSLGALDFLKTLSSYHGAQYKGPKYGRHNRWEYLGLVNEPCFDEATGPVIHEVQHVAANSKSLDEKQRQAIYAEQRGSEAEAHS
jgi:hypothetical protein